MQKEQRLRKSKDFRKVRIKVVIGIAILWSLFGPFRRNSEDLKPTRFGFVVSKRIGKAVVRNKYKRKMRSTVSSLNIECGWDVICIVKRGQTDREIKVVSDSMVDLLRRANLIVDVR
ncbi:MAG: hypothetical protein CM1200mP3_08620 [Chloroflexota bacterium]|nr:MAG: hypothetical protein CM1200mP3_08620 [Chloroflexota bacterium]